MCVVLNACIELVVLFIWEYTVIDERSSEEESPIWQSVQYARLPHSVLCRLEFCGTLVPIAVPG